MFLAGQPTAASGSASGVVSDQIRPLISDSIGMEFSPIATEDADIATKKVKHRAEDEDHPGYKDKLLQGAVMETSTEDLLNNAEIQGKRWRCCH